MESYDAEVQLDQLLPIDDLGIRQCGPSKKTLAYFRKKIKRRAQYSILSSISIFEEDDGCFLWFELTMAGLSSLLFSKGQNDLIFSTKGGDNFCSQGFSLHLLQRRKYFQEGKRSHSCEFSIFIHCQPITLVFIFIYRIPTLSRDSTKKS